jgi:hypothetical protein
VRLLVEATAKKEAKNDVRRIAIIFSFSLRLLIMRLSVRSWCGVKFAGMVFGV